jgi:murein DD-endopeptidase MepM/ murein hydrolase activator NlpD
MENLWDTTDRVLTGVGRFVLLRPGTSSLLLLTSVLLTFWTNGVFTSAHTKKSFVQSMPAVEITPAPAAEVILASQSITETTSQPIIKEIEITEEEPATILPQWYVMKVMPGDTLSGIFKRYDVSVAEAISISKLKDAKNALKNLKLGQDIRLLVNADNTVNELLYAINKENTLKITQTVTGFNVVKVEKPIAELALETNTLQDELVPFVEDMKIVSEAVVADSKQLPAPQKTTLGTSPEESLVSQLASADISNDAAIRYVSSEITHSLYVDARKAGLTVKQADQLGKIFSAKGLTRKLRKGDRISVLYEKSATDSGEKEGNVLLAQLTHKGETYQAIRFTDSNDKTSYFDANGKSLNTAITRKPINNARVSSHYSKSRKHPVLHVRRPHLGVDYAAKTGTPIKAAGDGVISYKGYKGGYGNTITIKHDSKYTTLYAHMSRFGKGMQKGTTVKEGQIIGYVGSTGLASGPHLHYEIHVNNSAQNPLTVALPGASVPQADKAKFLAQAKVLLAQLQLSQSLQLAKAADDPNVAS